MSFSSFLARVTGFDYAVYWPPTAPDAYGVKGHGSAVEIKVRWEDYKTDFVDREGKIITSKARIFTLTSLEFGGILWHGKLVDVVDIDEPVNNPEAREIRQIQKQASLKNQVTLYIIMV